MSIASDGRAKPVEFMERGLSARSLALGRVDGAWVEFATGFASATGG